MIYTYISILCENKLNALKKIEVLRVTTGSINEKKQNNLKTSTNIGL